MHERKREGERESERLHWLHVRGLLAGGNQTLHDCLCRTQAVHCIMYIIYFYQKKMKTNIKWIVVTSKKTETTNKTDVQWHTTMSTTRVMHQKWPPSLYSEHKQTVMLVLRQREKILITRSDTQTKKNGRVSLLGPLQWSLLLP